MSRRTIRVGAVRVGSDARPCVIAGPCVIESEQMCLAVARRLREICRRLGLGYVFKASFDKANRSSVDHYRGPGLQEGLRILSRVREEVQVPVLTDIHEPWQAEPAAEVVDMLQIPAYLCQQTDLVVAAARTGKPINLKKGQFLAPWDMAKICRKAEQAGNRNLLLTERGTTFGYNRLVWDVRSVPVMQALGYPVCVDVTHLVRLPGPASHEKAGGEPEYIAALARASAAVGADAMFLEIHPAPRRAKCDAASQLPLAAAADLLRRCARIWKAANSRT